MKMDIFVDSFQTCIPENQSFVANSNFELS